MNFPDK